jgi:transcriptional regulator with XRE-family HTH domain
MDVRRQVGLRIKVLREAQAISQEELAARAQLHRTYVSGVERGVRNPTVTVLAKLAAGLEVKLVDVVEGVELKKAKV